MQIELNKLNSNNQIELNEKLTIPSDYYQDSGIIDSSIITLTGIIKYGVGEDLILNLTTSGTIYVADSITLDKISLPFVINIEENISLIELENEEYFNKTQNTLDIMAILWQNIVLEVPIAITNCNERENISGDGWEFKDENKKTIDPRLAPLMSLLDEKEE